MSTIDDFRSATFAAQSYNATVAVAYASSPLGDPAIEDGSLSDLAKFEDEDPANYEDFPATTVTAKPAAEPRSSRGANLLVGAAVVAALGMVSGLGLMLVNGTGSKQEKPAAVVVPSSSVDSALPQAPSAVPPSPVAPAPPSVATPPDSLQGTSGPVGVGDAPALSGPAPAPVGPAAPADPGTPPAATPNTPPVIVNAPPPVLPVPIFVPVPPHHDGGKQDDGGKQGGGKQGGGNSGGGQQGGSGQQGGGQQGGKGQKVGGQPVPIGGAHPGQVACLPCQQGQAPGKK
jgi:uncharacterized membrane protein YgcG